MAFIAENLDRDKNSKYPRNSFDRFIIIDETTGQVFDGAETLKKAKQKIDNLVKWARVKAV